MSNLQPHPMKKQMASCPFNSAHVFQKDKLVFHINRCKDKAKRMPFMAKCKYNPMHFVDKQQLQLHEQYCQDKTSNQESTNKYQNNFRNAQRHDFYNHSHHQTHQQRDYDSQRGDRSRSRERKIEEIEQVHDDKGKIKFLGENDDQHFETLSDCEECQNIIRKFRPKLMENKKIFKLIKRIQELSSGSFTL